MANCFGFRCFRSEREGRASTPDPQTGSSQQSVSSPALQQAASSQETPPPPSLAEVKAQLEAVNNVNNVDELIKITQDFLEWRIAGMNVEDKAESSESVALRFIGTGETFFKFLTDHAEKSSNKGDFVKSVSRIIGDVLANLENVNWLVAGLSVIGYMLFTHNERSERYKRCLDLLQKLVDLSALVKKLDYRLRKQEEKLRKATVVIVKGCILCASQSSSHKLSRLLKDVVSGEDLNSLDKEIHDLHMDLNAAEQGLVTHSHIPPPFPHMDVNTEEQGIVTHSLIPPPFPDYADVFLSHSGVQKNFAAMLYKDLINEGVSCCFGQSREDLIFEAAKTCRVAVLLLSMDFIQSRWPMLELFAFLNAKKSGKNSNLKILPVFLKISPNDLNTRNIPDRTKTEISEKTGIKWQDISEALREVRKINGLRSKEDEVSFRDEIIRAIRILLPSSPIVSMPVTPQHDFPFYIYLSDFTFYICLSVCLE